MQTTSLLPSTTEPDIPQGDGERPYRLKLHPDVVSVVEKMGHDRRFRPSLEALFASIKADPKKYPSKRGKLQGYRAAKLRFSAVDWRCVFRIDEEERVIYVQSLAKHDDAYKQAERRT